MAQHTRKIQSQTTLALLVAGFFVALGLSEPLGAKAAGQAAPLLHWSFDEADRSAGTYPRYLSQFPQPERVSGIIGQAWRSDGFSSSVSAPISLDPVSGFTAAAWVALESYPSAIELPTDRQVPGSIFQQATDKAGFDLSIDTYGRWGFRVATENGIKLVAAAERFPLYRWVHVAVSYDPRSGHQRMFLDGRIAGEHSQGKASAFVSAGSDFRLARSWRDAAMLVFNINGINGAFDEVKLFDRPLGEAEIAALARADKRTGVNASLAVPASRFAQDHLRPRYHAMPPANWTNEPHGLVLANGRYHLFYQRTPNGPYKTQMHWGHMSSADLVNWTHQRDALRPELQSADFGFDMKGIWSGDVIVEGGKTFAYYTSVNHGRSYNPGISVAVSEDAGLRNWKKLGPVIDTRYVKDFRDPYLWRENGVWHMIIGAALKSGGGLDHYRCTLKRGKTCWEPVRTFSSLPFVKMDVGSVIWEMPVFEDIDGRRVLIVNPIGGKVSKYGDPATRGVYWLGQWTRDQFVPDATRPYNLDVIPGHLSPAVARQPNGKIAAIGIVDERRSPQAQEDAGWAHTFSLPREYFLAGGGKMLGQRPLPALQGLREGPAERVAPQRYRGATLIFDKGHQAEIKVSFAPDQPGAFGVIVAASPDGAEATRIVYDRASGSIILDKSKSTLSKDMEGPQVLRGAYDEGAFGPPTDWHVFVDGSVVDVFIGNGAAFSFRVYPTRHDATRVGIFAETAADIAKAEIWKLRPAQTSFDLDE